MSGPARGRRRRVNALRALLPCLALIAFDGTPARAQTLTPDLFRPVRDGFVLPQDLPLRRIGDNAPTGPPQIPPTTTKLRDKDKPAPSRIGQIPTYGLPAANGAADSGFDSLNRTRKKPKYLSGPGQAETAAGSRHAGAGDAGGACDFGRPRAAVDPAVGDRQQAADPAGDGRHGGRPAAAQAAEGRRRSVRRGRRLCRQLSGQVGGRTRPAATTPIPAAFLSRRARRSMWSRRNSSRSPTGTATRWSPICADRSPAMATAAGHRRRRGLAGADQCRPARFHRPCRRPPRCHPRHPPDRAGAAAGRHRQSRQPERPGRPCADIRSTPRSAAPSASTRISIACDFAAGGTVDRTSYQDSKLTDGSSPPTTTAISTSMAASAASATI